MSLERSLFRSHAWIAAVGTGLLLIGWLGTLHQRNQVQQLANTHAPASTAAATAYGGLQRSLAALRGWIQIDDPSLRTERQEAWSREVWPSVEELSALDADDAGLARLRANLIELEAWQFWIEDVAHEPGNIAAAATLARDVTPVADDVEARLDMWIAATENKGGAARQHVRLLQLQHAFVASRAALSRFVLAADPTDRQSFNRELSTATRVWGALEERPGSLGPNGERWLEVELELYREYAAAAATARTRDDWNRARFWLHAEAMPRAQAATARLEQISTEQTRLAQARTASIARWSNLSAAFGVGFLGVMLALTFGVSRRAARRLTQPIVALTRATAALAAGEHGPALPVARDDEVGELTRHFNAMRTALTEQERKFQTAVEATPAGLIMADGDGLIVLANPQAHAMFGYEAEELVGATVEDLLPARYRRAHLVHRTGFAEDPSTRRMGLDRRLTGLDKAGHEFPVEVRLSPVSTGNRSYTLAAVVDITDRLAAEKATEAARLAAERANRTKSEFLANMSHELRTPLNSVIGFSNLLLKNRKGNLLPADLRYLERVRDNGAHLLGLINSVLDLTKVESGRMELYITEFEVGRMLSATVDELQGSAEDKGLRLTVELPERDLTVSADEVRLKQVVINLVGNAIKFTARGSVVARLLEAGPWRGRPVIEIVDTGIGISPEQQERIFQPFQQADTSTTREYGGTGLGLSIARELCREMGFDLDVQSTPGLGSTFQVHLRAGNSASAEDDIEFEPTPMAEGTPVRLALVIDDDADARELIGAHLAELGWQIATAANGVDGLAQARTLRPALITVDLLMPRMAGWDVIRAVRSDPLLHATPVIVISQVIDRRRASLARNVGVMSKPVDPGALADAIRQVSASCILIVDDDPDARDLVRSQLAEHPVRTLEAANGAEALDVLDETSVDLVLLDLTMPVMDGFEFLARIRASNRWKDLPVVVLTARDLNADEQRALATATLAVLEKATDIEGDLERALEAAGIVLS